MVDMVLGAIALGLNFLLIILPVMGIAFCLFLVLASAHWLMHENVIETLGADARQAVDKATREYVDQVFITQLKKENQNEQPK